MSIATSTSGRQCRTTSLGLAVIIMTIAIVACAETAGVHPDAAFFSQPITIVDIRTEPEWRQTGIVKGSKTITFFDHNDEYDEAKFLKQLDLVVDKNEEFAIICRSGRRTRIAAQYLTQAGYKVIDLKGGVKYLPKIGISLVPYQAK
ncbi:rhodanese-like domain-containing protein [bacterium]|nr:rhodanese-like domain-containing protein [bacterium]